MQVFFAIVASAGLFPPLEPPPVTYSSISHLHFFLTTSSVFNRERYLQSDEQMEIEEKRLAEERRIIEEKRQAEEHRLAEEKRITEEKKLAEEKQRADSVPELAFPVASSSPKPSANELITPRAVTPASSLYSAKKIAGKEISSPLQYYNLG